MGLTKFSKYSLQPSLFEKVRLRTQEREKGTTLISSNFIEYLIKNGKRKGGSAEFGASSTITIYTVPKGKEYYLISAVLSGANSGAVTDIVELILSGHIIGLKIAPNENDSISLDLSIPLKFEEGETIKVLSSGMQVFGSVLGYEIDKIKEEQRV